MYMCHGQGCRYIGIGMVIPPFSRNPYNGYISPYYWVDDHPLLYGNNGSLDPGTYSITNPYNLHQFSTRKTWWNEVITFIHG